jgi:hypothetical protein
MGVFSVTVREAASFYMVGQTEDITLVSRQGLGIPYDVFQLSVIGHEAKKMGIRGFVDDHLAHTRQSKLGLQTHSAGQSCGFGESGDTRDCGGVLCTS